MSKDMMPMFELYQPTDIANALDLADKLGPDGLKVAGGNSRDRRRN
jgi:CO/xanthine dehydrogenase FAD-binding subunit